MPQWSYQRADWDTFKTICRTLLTTDVIDDNVVASRDRVVAAIIQATESSIPMVKPALNPLRKSVPFWTKECTEAVRKRNTAKTMPRTHDLNYWQLYYRLRGVAQHTIKTAEQQYWRDYCSTLDSSSKLSEVWGTVKKTSGARSRPSVPIIVEGSVVYDSNQEMAELFAEKFAAVSSDENLSSNFQARRAEFECQIKEVKPHDDESTETPDTASPYGQYDSINVPFEIHELTDAPCCGSMAGTPISALHVECGQPPLAIRRLRMIRNYAIKIKSVPDHPTLPILDNCWQNHYTVYIDGREPIGVKASKVFNKAKIHEIPSPARTERPTFAVYGSNDVVLPKDGPFWGWDDESHHFGKCSPKIPKKD